MPRSSNIHTIKPLDTGAGGFRSTIAAMVGTVEAPRSSAAWSGSSGGDARGGSAPKMLRIGVMDTFGESGPAVKLLERYGLDQPASMAR